MRRRTVFLSALTFALTGAPAARAADPVVVQNPTAFQPPDTPIPRAATGFGDGLALGVGAGMGTYTGPVLLQSAAFGQGWLAEYGEARVGWYFHHTSSLSLDFSALRASTSHGTLTDYEPGAAYRFHPSRPVWGEFALGFVAAPYTSNDVVGAHGTAYGFWARVSAGLVLYTAPTWILQAEAAATTQLLQATSGSFGVPFTAGLAVDYL